MNALNFNTSNQTLRQLLGNGLTYHVPRFQRDYSWTEAEWDDLWQDIMGLLTPDGESTHYMGYLVLRIVDDQTYEIIDGQQRLTTLSLFILAILKNLQVLIDTGIDVNNNQARIEELRRVYIGFLDPDTLVARPKLTFKQKQSGILPALSCATQKITKKWIKSVRASAASSI